LLGVGDDCALLRPDAGFDLAVTTDMLVEGRHFLPDAEARALGHKALAVNLSDLAAMGATPRWATLSIALPCVDADWLESAIDSSGTSAPELTLIDHVQTIEGGHAHEEEHAGEEEQEEEHEIDPHWWQDPHNAEIAVAEIEKALSAADADGAATYARNADAYTAEQVTMLRLSAAHYAEKAAVNARDLQLHR